MKKHLVFTMLLGLSLIACKEEFDFENQAQNTVIDGVDSDRYTWGTFISSPGNVFLTGDVITGFDDCLPKLQAAPDGDKSGYNVDCSGTNGGQTLFLYQNGALIDYWDEGPDFSSVYNPNTVDFTFTLPASIPEGSGYQIGIGSFNCRHRHTAYRVEPICRLSRVFSIEHPLECEIREAGRPISPVYRSGATLYFNFDLFSISGNRKVTYRILRRGLEVWSVTRSFANIQVDEWFPDRFNVILDPAQFPPDSYQLVADLDCWPSHSATTFSKSFTISR